MSLNKVSAEELAFKTSLTSKPTTDTGLSRKRLQPLKTPPKYGIYSVLMLGRQPTLRERLEKAQG